MEEIFVALMGVTGAGKSSFIKLLCSTGNQEIKIGHNLKSCTAVLDVYQCKYDQNTMTNLIDTPGFDDTDRTDSEVLRQITPWLTNTYRKNIQLSGIIYLHRITDTRMQGSAIRNLTNFKALCGPDALKNVILATSMWDKVDKLEGEEHEKELRNERDWWGWMCEKGSTTVRHDNTSESARRIIGRFVSKPTVVLKIQHDLVDLGKSFDDTDVGIELNKERAKAEAKFRKEKEKIDEGWRQALKEKDQEMLSIFTQLQDQIQAERQKQDQSYRQLQISMDQIQQEQRRYRDLELQLQTSEQNRRREADQLRYQLEQQRSLFQHPQIRTRQVRHQEDHVADARTVQAPVSAQRPRPSQTQEPRTARASAPAPAPVPVPVVAPAPAPAPTPDPTPVRVNRPPLPVDLNALKAVLLWCEIEYRPKSESARRGKFSEPGDYVLKMHTEVPNDTSYPVPASKQDFLNLVQRVYGRSFVWIFWETKLDIPWSPQAWFPGNAEYEGQVSRSWGVFSAKKRWWTTYLG